MMTRDDYVTLWVCEDCAFAHAGFDEHEMGRPYPPETLSLIGDEYEVTAGMVDDEHATDCPVFPELENGTRGRDDSAECDCERREFTWAACRGCGSELGGSRYALTLWMPGGGSR